MTVRAEIVIKGNLKGKIKEFKKEAGRVIAEEILIRAKQNIEDMNIDTTGRLKESGLIEKMDDNVYKVGFYAPYAIFVETGTNNYARPPPFDKIFIWVKEKFGYDDDHAKAVAKIIQNEIFANGIEPKPFFRSALYSVQEELMGMGVRKLEIEKLERGEYRVLRRVNIAEKIKGVFSKIFGR